MGAMGFYGEQIFPRGLNIVMNNKALHEVRRRVCSGLHGEVLEVGFGTGLNLPFLPPTVDVVRAVEPSGVGVRLARKRIAASAAPVEIDGLDGQSLPFADASADSALCTWTLCTIPDAVAAVREVRRVLRPGGTLHFVEHGRADDASVRRWQDRLNGLQRRMACGCNLNRDIVGILEAGGMRVTALERYYNKGEPKFIGYLYEGVATAA
jgi:SAM-dependent methyltransferase